jgi:hypothetical protein
MSRLDINAVRCEALFVSPLQRSDRPTSADVRLVITHTVRTLGSRGCAARVAQEFGDHPEGAVERMRWARELVTAAATEATRPAEVHARRFGQRPVTMSTGRAA